MKLAVLLVFDQMRADYLETWRGLFGSRGFKRLQSEGAWFTHCNYPYGTTTTGPGHASILTGTCPDRHGIINNEWYDGGTVVNCAEWPEVKLVPPVKGQTKPATDAKPKGAGSPKRLLAETVADVLRTTRPASKAFGLSLKDRSAVLPMGQNPSGAFWFDGRFVTSDFYEGGLPDWLVQFNRSTQERPQGGANWWFGKDWVPGREGLNYFDWLDPSIQAGGKPTDSRLAFRHPNTEDETKPGKKYYNHLGKSPYGNELLLAMAKTCVQKEALGKRRSTDLLVVSFSSNDLVGHAYGPDSPEVMDVTVRSDDIVAELLDFLDVAVGRGQYLLAVTADHGVCPVPSVATRCGIPEASLVLVKQMEADLEAHLNARFGRSPEAKPGAKRTGWVEALGTPSTFPWVYLNSKLIAASGRTREEVAQEAADFLMQKATAARSWKDHVARTFTRKELAAGFPQSDAIANQVRRSFCHERSGDVYVLLKPYCIPGDDFVKGGTTHGSPWSYDTHVPLLVYGPGVAGGIRQEPVTPQATAAIFSKWLGLPPPNKAEFPVPATLEVR